MRSVACKCLLDYAATGTLFKSRIFFFQTWFTEAANVRISAFPVRAAFIGGLFQPVIGFDDEDLRPISNCRP